MQGRLIGWGGFGVCVALLLLAGAASAAEADAFGNAELAEQLYDEAAHVLPSRIGDAAFTKIIEKRLECYGPQTQTPLERFRVCGTPYVNEIIRTARAAVQSKPELGLFIRRVQYCPIVHSMCVGEHQEPGQCLQLERRCIDAALDKYWRGATAPSARD
jgi:hypothetical protein